MVLARPKRKATNRSYNEVLDSQIFDEQSLKVTSAKLGRKRGNGHTETSPTKLSNSQTASASSIENTPTLKTGSALPYNWQPAPEPQDYFSRRLDLIDAWVDESLQTLHCPNMDANDDVGTANKSLLVAKKPSKGKFQETVSKKDRYLTLQKHDFIYMVSEPPGEPYYVGLIMGFERKASIKSNQQDDAQAASNYVFKIQWYYRPRDIAKTTTDSRLLFASMHSDTCPLASFRGLVTVRHKDDIEWLWSQESAESNGGVNNSGQSRSKSPTPASPLEEYATKPNCFYFNQLFDRYMIKFYDVIPTALLVRQGSSYRQFVTAINKRFEYIFMESPMTKTFINSFLASASNCDKCGQWCATQDSVRCIDCEKYFHMHCLDPPLLKKPSRGFSWTCAPCLKKQANEHQQKSQYLMLSHDNKLSNLDEMVEKLTEDSGDELLETNSPKEPMLNTKDPKFEIMAEQFLALDKEVTLEERRTREEWNMRYLGMYARLEDGVDLEDRSPYPRALTRLGAKHQAANIPECDGHPIVYYDLGVPTKGHTKKKKRGGRRKDRLAEEEENKLWRELKVPEEYKDIPESEYPDWLQPRPQGYIERGEDDGEGNTCTLLYKPDPVDIEDDFQKLDSYVHQCTPVAENLNLIPTTPNFMDQILHSYMVHKGDIKKALDDVSKFTRETLKEPTFSKEEIARFEAGVRKNGSELYPTFKMIKTQPCAMVVRFYYLWKKTHSGRQIWGNFEGRLHKKVQNQKEEQKVSHPTEIDCLATPNDDSSYETSRIENQKKKMACKHCQTTKSFFWYRITGFDAKTKVSKTLQDKYDKNSVVGLCFRCARLWRRYAVVWEDPLEVMKKNTKGIGGWKKKLEHELVQDAEKIIEESERLGGGIIQTIDIQNKGSSILDLPEKSVILATKYPVSLQAKNDILELPTKKRKSSSSNGNGLKPETKKPTVKKLVDSEKNTKVNPTESKPGPKRGSKKRTGNDIKIEEKDLDEPIQKVAKPPVKKQKAKKAAKSAADIVRETNRDSMILLSLRNLMKNNYEVGFVPLDEGSSKEEELLNLLQNFKTKQLVEIERLAVQASVLPKNASINFPFPIGSRQCCICQDGSHISGDEILICSNCGVNVHSSCACLQIGSQVDRPVKEWLCEPCINDMDPQHSTLYSCSLCLAYESNHELSILGSRKVKPDYLRPVLDSGKWCHLLCALFSQSDIKFKLLTSQRYKKNDSVNQMFNIPSCSGVYLRNYDVECGICKVPNGCLVQCELCETPQSFHATCAQDRKDFSVGFMLLKSDELESRIVRVNEESGVPKLVIICPNHDQSTVHSLHTMASRISATGKEEKRSLIQLYVEEKLKKMDGLKLTGPQARANMYIELSKAFFTKEHIFKKRASKTPTDQSSPDSLQHTKFDGKICNTCDAKFSPMWWLKLDGSYNCQACQINEREEEEEKEVEATEETLAELGDGKLPTPKQETPSQTLIDLLNEELTGERFGLKNMTDALPIVTSS